MTASKSMYDNEDMDDSDSDGEYEYFTGECPGFLGAIGVGRGASETQTQQMWQSVKISRQSEEMFNK